MKGTVDNLRVRIRILDEAETILRNLQERVDSISDDIKVAQNSKEEQERIIKTTQDDSEEWKAAKRQLYWDQNGIEENTTRKQALEELIKMIMDAL